MVDQVFVLGLTTSFIPLIYISSESIACALRASIDGFLPDEGGYDGKCEGLTFGVKAMNIQAVGVFVYSISVGQLMAKQMGGVKLSSVVRLDFESIELLQLNPLMLSR